MHSLVSLECRMEGTQPLYRKGLFTQEQKITSRGYAILSSCAIMRTEYS